MAIATAIPREVDGAAAVREESEARMKATENLKYILSRTIKRFVDAHLWFGKSFYNNYEPTEISGTLLGFIFDIGDPLVVFLRSQHCIITGSEQWVSENDQICSLWKRRPPGSFSECSHDPYISFHKS